MKGGSPPSSYGKAEENRRRLSCAVQCAGGEDVIEISLAENEVRQAMHPADQFDAFKALAEGGMSDDDIAARFGVPVQVVRQRLKLSRVSPKLIAAYRKGEMLDCLMAFAVSDDHKQQEKVWKELPPSRSATRRASAIR